MPISTDRIRADIQAIARFTDTPGAGASRPTFSNSWRQARDYVIDQAQRAGCAVRIDAFGNVHVRPQKLAWDAPAWLCGSHIDSVPHGGDYDGVTGIVVPLEILRADNSVPLELIIFAEEEGTTFGLGMLGSRAWVGDLSSEKLAEIRNKSGENYLQAGAKHGVDANAFERDRLVASHYRGLIEVHIEQGPGMWNKDQRIAIVRAIAGRKQYHCTLRGVANHAGSTSMHDRKDALVGAATLILQYEGLARGILTEAVMTVGKIICKPNAVNVIPDEVEFTIDFRAPDNEVLADGHQRILDQSHAVATKRGLTIDIIQTEDQSAVAMDSTICGTLMEKATKHLGTAASSAISGALHDSAILAPHLPTAMLFVPSKDGISHNPAEFSRVEDIALAAKIVYDTVK
ncbi:MAG TPA: Zn-dependent hydrolase [Tepidisphaeraceae bacterium]|jgi:hydantoinase/carbamoylase family amidase|nr:Zn-dependent hydrolase [Tepidisphaeraceae bacterium]